MALEGESNVVRERVLWSETPTIQPPPATIKYNPNDFSAALLHLAGHTLAL